MRVYGRLAGFYGLCRSGFSNFFTFLCCFLAEIACEVDEDCVSLLRVRIILNKESSMIPLAMLAAGEIGKVLDVLGDENCVKRMSELGLRIGSSIEVLQKGSPCVIRFGETKLCFRDSELLNVLVQPSACPV